MRLKSIPNWNCTTSHFLNSHFQTIEKSRRYTYPNQNPTPMWSCANFPHHQKTPMISSLKDWPIRNAGWCFHARLLSCRAISFTRSNRHHHDQLNFAAFFNHMCLQRINIRDTSNKNQCSPDHGWWSSHRLGILWRKGGDSEPDPTFKIRQAIWQGLLPAGFMQSFEVIPFNGTKAGHPQALE